LVMASEGDIPSVESVANDLRVIIRDGIERFSVESLEALPMLDSARPQGGHSPNVLSIKTTLIRYLLHLGPDWKRDSALALFGLTGETHSADLPTRREAAGTLWNPPVAASTFRAPRNGESRIVNELAAALHLDETSNQRFAPGTKQPLLDQTRSRISLEFEHRLGYRWVRYRRTVGWDDKAQTWHNQLSLEIEALRAGTRIIEYDYVGPQLVIVGAPVVEPAGQKRPSYLSSVDSDFDTYGYNRARFDLGRELFVDERVTLTVSYNIDKPGLAQSVAPSFGLVSPFDHMELIELAFAPVHPECSFVFISCLDHLGAIIMRRHNMFVPEDRLADGSYTGVFTAICAQPLAGVTYGLELVEIEGVDVRKTLADHGVT
jgi:hypothetical protein